jgi:hypothetical protein
MGFKRIAACAVAALAIGTGVSVAAAPAASAAQCGYWEDSGWWSTDYYYTHCGGSAARVYVREYRTYVPKRTATTSMCVGARQTVKLSRNTDFAWSSGERC